MSEEILNVKSILSEGFVHKLENIVKTFKPKQSLPIGVFDSGVGGLTVLEKIIEEMPHEDLIYLADTARVPYGGRPPQEIIEINKKILDYFESIKIKMVVMACGTSSAIAYPVYKDSYKFPIISMVGAGAKAAAAATKNNKVGVIATLGTVSSGAFKKAIQEENRDIKVFMQACPLFVPLIEGGFVDTEETKKVAQDYLKPLLSGNIDTLVLGCTHYPHLKKILKEIVGPNIALIDPSENVAFEAKDRLRQSELLNAKTHLGSVNYIVTGQTAQFEEIGSRLLNRQIKGAKRVEI